MKIKRNLKWPAITAMAVSVMAPLAEGAFVHDVTGWVVHNGASTLTGGDTNNPTTTPAGSSLVVLAPTVPVSLAQQGDYVKFTAQLTLTDRTANLAVNSLNTQLRFGIFSGPDGAVTFEDAPNFGFIGQYANANQGWARLRSQETNHVDPFFNGSLTALTDGTADAEGDSISGANPPSIDLEITVTRNASGTLDIAGLISGGNYLSTFSYSDYDSAPFPAGGPFTFNRVGLWFGGNVSATSATISDAVITTNVPEPTSGVLLALAATGGLGMGRRW